MADSQNVLSSFIEFKGVEIKERSFWLHLIHFQQHFLINFFSPNLFDKVAHNVFCTLMLQNIIQIGSVGNYTWLHFVAHFPFFQLKGFFKQSTVSGFCFAFQ